MCRGAQVARLVLSPIVTNRHPLRFSSMSSAQARDPRTRKWDTSKRARSTSPERFENKGKTNKRARFASSAVGTNASPLFGWISDTYEDDAAPGLGWITSRIGRPNVELGHASVKTSTNVDGILIELTIMLEKSGRQEVIETSPRPIDAVITHPGLIKVYRTLEQYGLRPTKFVQALHARLFDTNYLPLSPENLKTLVRFPLQPRSAVRVYLGARDYDKLPEFVLGCPHAFEVHVFGSISRSVPPHVTLHPSATLKDPWALRIEQNGPEEILARIAADQALFRGEPPPTNGNFERLPLRSEKIRTEIVDYEIAWELFSQESKDFDIPVIVLSGCEIGLRNLTAILNHKKRIAVRPVDKDEMAIVAEWILMWCDLSPVASRSSGKPAAHRVENAGTMANGPVAKTPSPGGMVSSATLNPSTSVEPTEVIYLD